LWHSHFRSGEIQRNLPSSSAVINQPAADDVRRQNGRQLALDPEGLECHLHFNLLLRQRRVRYICAGSE